MFSVSLFLSLSLYIYTYICMQKWRWHPHLACEGGGGSPITLKKVGLLGASNPLKNTPPPSQT